MLRLDVREDALNKESFVPGKPAESLLIERILTTDADELMPPPESHKQLTARQKEILQRWIEQGAEYQPHWAFVPPTKPTLPSDPKLAPIDHLIQATLKENGLTPSPLADAATLIRRVSLDLCGKLPAPEDP